MGEPALAIADEVVGEQAAQQAVRLIVIEGGAGAAEAGGAVAAAEVGGSVVAGEAAAGGAAAAGLGGAAAATAGVALVVVGLAALGYYLYTRSKAGAQPHPKVPPKPELITQCQLPQDHESAQLPVSGIVPTTETGFDPKDLRKPKEESLKRDKERGFEPELGKKDGKDVTYLIFEAPPKNQRLIYVKLKDGTFRFSPRPRPSPLDRRRRLTLPHSMMSRGDEVIGAGECETDESGKIKSANNFSGHYQPNEANLRATKKNMEQRKLTADQTDFPVYDKTGQVIKKLQ